MYIYDYIDEYGIYSFEDKPLNEVDITLFTYLSYVNFENVVSKNKITIKDAAQTHQGLHKKDETNVIAVKDATKLLYYMKDTKRYRNCLLYNYKYVEDNDIQFGVITIEYQKNKIFISYEGTNEQISGWKENLMLTYNFPTRSHIKAIDYLNHHYTFTSKKIIVGGHSKGGNLALVAAMCSNIIVKNKIEQIYNIDGPGLLKKQFESKRYKKIIDKYTHIIPDDSLIGILLYSTNYKIIKTNKTGPLAHHILYWEINKNIFKKAPLSSFSKELQTKIREYVEKTNDNDLEKIVGEFSKLCENANVKTLLDIKTNHKKVIDLIYQSKNIDRDIKKSLFEFINLILAAFGDSIYDGIKKYIDKIKKEIENEIK